jgi:hypothetical protein
MGCICSGSWECGKHGFSFLADFPDHYLYVPVNPEEPFMGLITDIPRLRERTYVFSDRHDAGRQLGAFLKTLPGIRNPLVLAIPDRKSVV